MDLQDRPDGQLLAEFARTGAETCMEELMRRHGHLVYNVSLRILGSAQDAEDVTQAVFLTLSQKASSLSGRESVAGWLHRVARHVSLRERDSQHARAAREKEAAAMSTQTTAPSTCELEEFKTMLDEEVDRLPEKYRLPILLHHFEGRTEAEAAKLLAGSVGAISMRLSRGREMLRQQLGSRGVVLGALPLSAAISAQAQAVVPPALIASTAHAASLIATGHSVAASVLPIKAVALSQQALTAMFVAKMKIGAAIAAMVLVAAVGTGTLAHVAGGTGGQPAPAGQKTAAAAPFQPLPAPHETGDEKEPPPKPAAPRPQNLPPGVVARLGGTQFRAGNSILGLRYSPDGKFIYSTKHGGVLEVWDAVSGEPLKRKENVDGKGFVLSPDGKRLFLGGTNNVTRVLDSDTLEEAYTVASTGSNVSQVACSPDGKLLAIGNYFTVQLVSAADGTAIWDFGAGMASAFSPDNKQLAVAVAKHAARNQAGVKPVRVFDVATGNEAYSIETGADPAIDMLEFSPDGRQLAVVDDKKGELQMFDTQTKKLLFTVLPEKHHFNAAAFSPDGKWIAAAGYGNALILDAKTGVVAQDTGINSPYMNTIAFSPDGKKITIGGMDGVVHIWDAENKKKQKASGHTNKIASVAFSPDGQTVVTGSDDASIRLWNASTGEELRVLQGHSYWMNDILFSRDGRHLVSGAQDDHLIIWDAQAGTPIQKVKCGNMWPQYLSWAPDGKSVRAMGNYAVLREYAVPAGNQILARNMGNGHPLDHVAFSPDGTRIAIGKSDHFLASKITLYDYASGKQVAQFTCNENERAAAMAYSPDGTMLAWGSGAGIHLCSVENGKDHAVMKGHEHWPTNAAIVFSLDQRWLVSGGDDRKIIVWEIASGKEVCRLGVHNGPITALSFSADGHRFVSGSSDTTAVVWNLLKVPAGNDAVLAQENNPAALWPALASDNGGRALNAIQRMVLLGAPAVKYIGEKLEEERAEQEPVAALFKKLDDIDFDVRSAAEKELIRNDYSEAALQAALKQVTSLDVRKTAQRLIQRHTHPVIASAVTLQWLRAILALEWDGSDGALKILGRLAETHVGTRIGVDAGKALDRLKLRLKPISKSQL